MGYKRAEWHSGLTYQQTCENCKTVLQYTDYSLDFRPWYADGYVDCPKCKNHLRHDEKYALGNPELQPQVVETPVQEQPAYAVEREEQVPAATPEVPAGLPAFCTSCGNKFGPNDRFCAQCGAKRA